MIQICDVCEDSVLSSFLRGKICDFSQKLQEHSRRVNLIEAMSCNQFFK